MIETAEARQEVEAAHGQVWDTDEMQARFCVIGFGGPGFCVVTDNETGKKGSLAFTHMPRFYHSFVEA